MNVVCVGWVSVGANRRRVGAQQTAGRACARAALLLLLLMLGGSGCCARGSARGRAADGERSRHARICNTRAALNASTQRESRYRVR